VPSRDGPVTDHHVRGSDRTDGGEPIFVFLDDLGYITLCPACLRDVRQFAQLDHVRDSQGDHTAMSTADAASGHGAGQDHDDIGLKGGKLRPDRRLGALPILIIAITAPTPMMMPSMVRAERRRFRLRTRNATEMVITRS